jgi:superfamily II DNA or RNA helicase
MVKIRIKNHESVIEGMPIDIRDELWEYLSFDVPGAKWSPKFKDNIEDPEEREKGWDGKIHLLNRRFDTFLTGLMYKTCTFLKEKYDITPVLVDERLRPSRNLILKWNEEKFKLREEYQPQIVETCIRKGRAVIEAATGSGKTIIVSKIIQELGVTPFLFYVLTKDLMRQAKKMLEESIIGLKVGTIGDGECDIRDINVVTIQSVIYALYGKKYFENNLKKIKESSGMDDLEFKEFKKEKLIHIEKKKDIIVNLIENAQGIYADEIHHYSSKMCQDVIKRSPKAYYRFGGSATPLRSDNSYLFIEGLFGRKTSVITASSLIKMGYLMKPKIKFIRVPGRSPLLMTWSNDRKYNINECDERNTCIIKTVKKLQEKNIKTLVLIQTISHGKYLEKHIPNSVFIHGSSSKKKREETLEQLNKGEITTVIGSSIADEGLDIPSLSALFNCGGGKSPVRAKQRVGRVIRKGSDYALVYDFIDRGKWSKKHTEERMKLLKTEKEFDLEVVEFEEIMKLDDKVLGIL